MLWFDLALVALAFALLGPVDAAASRSLSWHMVQHLLIVSVAAPLLALSRPVELLLDAIAPQGSRRLPRRRGPWIVGLAAVVALATLFTWHVPAFYQAALLHEPLHVLEHVTLLATATMSWAALVTTPRHGASVVWLFVITLPVTVFGVAMTLARTPWYSEYVTSGPADAVRDQQLAGVIMWAFGGIAAVAGGVALFASWIASPAAGPRPTSSMVGTDEAVPTW